MSTPTGRPARPASAFDYAPKRVREQWSRGDTDDAADAEAATDPPRDLDEDRPPSRARSDEDDHSSLVPKGPHEPPVSAWDEAEDEWAERWDVEPEPEDRAAHERHAEMDGGESAYDAQDRQEQERSRDPFDEPLERLAATLKSLQRETDSTSPERPAATQARSARRAFTADAADREVYIDGTRLPRFLQPSYVPPRSREGGNGLVGAMLAVGVASMVAAPLAYYVAFGNPFASAPRAIARPELQYSVASTSTSLPRPEQQAVPIASAVAPNAPVARTEPQATGPRLTAVRPLEPPAEPTASMQAPRAVPLTHVMRWPDAAQDSGASQPPAAPRAAPTSEQPRADAAPLPAPNASAYAMATPAPVAAPPQPALPRPPVHDADDVALLLKQGQDFIAAGDFATARVVLRRAAEAGAAAAALALGQTYDPNALAKMRARGVVPDAEQARRWYETAQRLGSGEAAQRLERLARDE